MKIKIHHLLILLFIVLFIFDIKAQDTDVVPADTIPPSSSSSAIDAPINYAAKDSMVMIMDGTNMLYLFGEGDVTYTNLNLKGEYIEIDADSSIVFSTFGLDSIGQEFGYPVFKEGETEYEMKKARYNFKTKKMYINDVITQQGEGYIVAERTKKMPNDDLFMEGGRYTTCDEHDHPHFYLQLSRAKVRPKKNVVTGPAYLVVEDVPLPIWVPFAFFPFTSDYSSGIIMPSYDDELRRGFSLRDGGYYFALSDYVDLALTGEIYTKGSWGLNVASSYKKRYKYSGNLKASYRFTKIGDREGDPDYSKSKDFQVTWSHTQDAKAHPFRTFSASVNFSTQSYLINDVSAQYTEQATNNTKASSVNYSYRFPDSPFTLNVNASISQVTRDTTLSVTLPNLTLTMTDIYPFKRKEQIGGPRWYESIRFGYTGTLKNSLIAKENEFFDKNLIKDWNNGIQHTARLSATFNLFKYISLTPSLNYTENWYSQRVNKAYDLNQERVVPVDTTYNFYRTYNFNGSISLNTKLYGFFKPWKIFGDKASNTIIRHVFTPTVSFSGSPDFSDPKFGAYENIRYLREVDRYATVDTTYYSYSPFEGLAFSPPGRGQSASLSFNIVNNIEMKVPIADSDSTRKISLIDNFSFGWGYNFLADSMKWNQTVSANLRLKLSKSFTLNLNGQFDMYTYNEEGRKIDKLRLTQRGKGIARLMSTGTSFSYSLSNTKIKEWFNKDKKEGDGDTDDLPRSDTDPPEGLELPPGEEGGGRTSLRQKKKSDDKYDDDGYWLTDIPWNLNFNCSANLGYDTGKFNKEKREYAYKFVPTFGLSGNISPTKNWNFSFNADYDFEVKKVTRMTCTITRKMHCWQMSASIIPIGPYQSYHFTIAVSSSMLRDLKYTQSSNNRDAMNWGN